MANSGEKSFRHMVMTPDPEWVASDDNPLTARENDMEYRKEQLRRLQTEVVDLDDLRQGVGITDLGAEKLRFVSFSRRHELLPMKWSATPWPRRDFST
jgi:hypothetical protein